MNTRHTLYLVMLTFVGCTCNQAPADEPFVPMPKVTSERAKEFVEEQKALMDSSVTEESLKNLHEQATRLDTSSYADFTNEQIEAKMHEWVSKYRNSCDTAVYADWKRRLTRDAVFVEWSRDRYQVSRSVEKQMKAARDSCNGTGAGG